MSIDFKKLGVTFIEMLLVVSLLSMIGLTIYQSIAGGIKIWEKSQRFIIDEDVAIFLDKISQDLRNSLNYSLISFKGRETKIIFATIVLTAADKHATVTEGYIHQIGQVEYSFDKIQSSLLRRQANYSQATDEEFGPQRVMVSPLHSVRFSYYYGTNGGTEIKRKAEGAMPSAVKVEIEFLEETGKMREVVRLIPVPVGV